MAIMMPVEVTIVKAAGMSEVWCSQEERSVADESCDREGEVMVTSWIASRPSYRQGIGCPSLRFRASRTASI